MSADGQEEEKIRATSTKLQLASLEHENKTKNKVKDDTKKGTVMTW